MRVFKELINDKKVTITGKSPNQTILINGVPVIKLENNQIATLTLPEIEQVRRNFFLYNNENIETLDMPNLKYIGAEFLIKNTRLARLYLPKLINKYSLKTITQLRAIISEPTVQPAQSVTPDASSTDAGITNTIKSINNNIHTIYRTQTEHNR